MNESPLHRDPTLRDQVATALELVKGGGLAWIVVAGGAADVADRRGFADVARLCRNAALSRAPRAQPLLRRALLRLSAAA
jgi:hypothetical protein